VVCPEDFAVSVTDEPFLLEGASPEGGEYLYNRTPIKVFDPYEKGKGKHVIDYYYSDDITECSNICDFVITVESQVYAESTIRDFVNIYPNPNDGNFYIRFSQLSKKVKYKIFDMKGQVIKYDNISLIDSSTIEINMGGAPSGIYYLVIRSGEKYIVEKIIVRRSALLNLQSLCVVW